MHALKRASYHFDDFEVSDITSEIRNIDRFQKIFGSFEGIRVVRDKLIFILFGHVKFQLLMLEQFLLEINFCEVWLNKEIDENLGRLINIGGCIELLFGKLLVKCKKLSNVNSVTKRVLLLLQLLFLILRLLEGLKYLNDQFF